MNPQRPGIATHAGLARKTEIDEHHLPGVRHHEIRGLDVAVHDRWIVLVQVVERGRRLTHVLDHRRVREAGSARSSMHRREILARRSSP